MGDNLKTNERGFTLIEVLAALALVSLIILLAGSMNLFGTKQTNSQKAEIQNQSNDRLAMNMVTKAIRQADPATVEVINDQNILKINNVRYYLDGTSLKKETDVLISDIQRFTVKRNGDQILLEIGKLPQTKLYLRD
ncbi:prepilin-type N-terminal cleavage/methylation domain-containing protein [Neobacillus sp. DY30]|uniref:PilW family protein n=1 Tax=Neobacillus sp. DY30 TaxID=3047871 RepID=UPI0024BFA879|nr:prepilin-type N-terminal cleavage/methylation domain-containing protein [Neobacillus sp. DY30]WHX99494.1 prepilin-type N-terminal cleavage/methylation domain-containing protein [Neobacillus sp. DY30]